MNKTERAKVTALNEHVRLAWVQWDIRFVRNMVWVRDNDPRKTLTGPQKWGLDVLIYKYRRQLGGLELGFEIPHEPPVAADYGVPRDAVATQKTIFGTEEKPRPTRIDRGEDSPQRSLF